MAFQQGLSGLNAAARNLDVIGHNVANANTVGAKASRAEFADIYANSLYGAGGNDIGLGVSVAAVTQQFTQGDITTTASGLDLAINGGGFFRLSDAGSVTYTRNGQFQLDKDGYIVTSQGARLTGYQADAFGNVSTGVPGDIRMDSAGVPPKATDAATVTVNIDARSGIPVTAFSLTDATSYTGATSIAVFDSQGNEHTVGLYFRRVADNTWEAYGSADGVQMGAAPLATLTFGADGRLPAGTPTIVNATVPISTAAGGTLSVPIDLSKMTQWGAAFSVSELSQNGHTAGNLAGFSIAGDGTVLSRYTNGVTKAQGRVALVDFANPQGLQPLGRNQWAQTADSGEPKLGTPGAGSLGILQSGALEQSNVDLTSELVNMITAQRVYQANAQTIRTQDQMMQTIVNLR